MRASAADEASKTSFLIRSAASMEFVGLVRRHGVVPDCSGVAVMWALTQSASVTVFFFFQ